MSAVPTELIWIEKTTNAAMIEVNSNCDTNSPHGALTWFAA